MAGIVVGERKQAIAWSVRSGMIAVLAMFLVMPLSLPLKVLIDSSQTGLTLEIWEWLKGYFLTLIPQYEYWIGIYVQWFKSSGFMPIEVAALSFGTGVFTFIIGHGTNPYTFDKDHSGAGRLAKTHDVEKMGLFEGWLMVLGQFKGKILRLKETLSILCVAPPGTGKTTGIVVPTILDCDNVSMVVNDVKPEIFDITSGYRSKHSLCLRLEWSASDRPEDGVFFPRWNPLSPLSMPEQGSKRDLYVDRMVGVLIPDPGGNADPHWTNKARATLAGFIHYIVSKCEAGNYDGLPDIWYGEEPCLPMLLDWITEAQFRSQEEIEALRNEDPNLALFADPVKNFLLAAVKECRDYGYSQRAGLEMTQLANTPDKERGSILSTMDSGLTIFKNAAVRARTSQSDFAFKDLRGVLDPETGEMKPLTIYICVNQEDAKALSVITGVFVETLSAWLVANPPEAITETGEKVGPYPVLFVLDEFPQMPKLKALINGPAVGRGQKVSYMLIGQDLGQISGVYGKEETETIISTTAAKVILPLNNEQTAERFAKMVGNKTVVSSSYSKTEGFGPGINPFQKNVSRQDKGTDVVRMDELMSMPKGKQLVLYQGFVNKPIFCETPYYFKNKKYKNLVNPKNGGKYKPAAPMPEWMRQARIREEQTRLEFRALSAAE